MRHISDIHFLGAGQKEKLRETGRARASCWWAATKNVAIIPPPPSLPPPPPTPPPSPAVQTLHANLQLKWLQFGRFIHSKYKSGSSRIFREPSSEKLLYPAPALKLTVEPLRGGSIAGALG